MPVAARYRNPDRARGLVQLATSFLPYIVLWMAMVWSLRVGYWLTLLLSIPTAGFLIRIFIIQHDCGHGSFLKSRKAMDWIGSLAGVLTLVPYDDWRRSHAIHHAGAGRLSDRGVGDIHTWTVREYRSRGWFARLRYRIYRNPLVMFGVGPLVLFGIMYRFPDFGRMRRPREVAGVLTTNAALGGLVVLVGELIGFRNLAMVQVPISLLACTAGVWLFYVQHQFEGTYWSDGEEWNYTSAALRGSSYYQLPRVLQWFCGNIGFHHIHHLSPRIPSYHLERCHAENPMFQDVPTLTLRSSLATVTLALWDEEQRRMVSFGDLRRRRAA